MATGVHYLWSWSFPFRPQIQLAKSREPELHVGLLRRFAIPRDCQSCTLRHSGDFCDLPQPGMSEFNGLGHLTLYPPNATLLREGQFPRGVYIACAGRFKLSVEARDGKTIILKITGDRQVLGLSAVVTGRPSPITVTTIELCQIKFVESESFLHLIAHNSHAALACATLLARESRRHLMTSTNCCWPAVPAKAGPAVALLGLGRASQPGTPRAHRIHPRRNCADDRLLARNRDSIIECHETERFNPALRARPW